MVNYTKKNVWFLTLLISTAVFCMGNAVFHYFTNEPKEEYTNENAIVENAVTEEVMDSIEHLPNPEVVAPELQAMRVNSWRIIIPKFGLNAGIEESTSKTVMDQWVGHFEHTSTWEGNIGLAAHNRLSKVNYFAHVKDLEMGDAILYQKDGNTKEYIVDAINTIAYTDWSYLEPTTENKITLITCIAGQPTVRLCVQGTEKR